LITDTRYKLEKVQSGGRIFVYKGCGIGFWDNLSQKDAILPGDRMPSLRVFTKQIGSELNPLFHGYELLSLRTDGSNSRPKCWLTLFVIAVRRSRPFTDGRKHKNVKSDGTKPAWFCLAHAAL